MINISWPLLDLLSGCCSRCTTFLMADHVKTGSHHRAIAWGVYTTAARSPDTGNGGQRGSHSKFKNIAEFSGWLARSDQYLFLCSELPGFESPLWSMDNGHTATMGTKQYFSFSKYLFSVNTILTVTPWYLFHVNPSYGNSLISVSCQPYSW